MRIGKVKESALKRSVLKQIRTEFKENISAAVGSDCAFSESGKAILATATVTPKVSGSGYYAVMKATGSLVAQGIAPEYVTVNILLDEESDEQCLKKIVSDCIRACKKYGILYAGGHTEVTTAVKRPVVSATCAGSAADGTALYRQSPKAGDALVISKWIGLEGTAMLAAEKREELLTRYPAPFIDDAARFEEYLDISKEADIAIKAGISGVHDISSGGVFAALWEMGERANAGLSVDLKKLPIRQETIEVCEFFELNPYQLLSGGALLFAAGDGDGLAERLNDAQIPAAVIGSLTEGRDRGILNQDEKRFLDLPQADEIHKILV